MQKPEISVMMFTALQSLSDGETKRGIHAIPDTSPYKRNPALRALEKRGLVKKMYASDIRDGRPVVYWKITDEGLQEFRLIRASLIMS